MVWVHTGAPQLGDSRPQGFQGAQVEFLVAVEAAHPTGCHGCQHPVRADHRSTGSLADEQVLAVHPVPYESLPGRSLALRYFVLVVGKDVINSACVYVYSRTQVFYRHG